MSNREKQALKDRIDAWRRAERTLEIERRDAIRRSDALTTIPIFDDAFRSAAWLGGLADSSGLVEFHRILALKK